MSGFNPYEVLGVARDATLKAIKRAYRLAASKHHPDRGGKDPTRMTEVNRAMALLENPERRAHYDATGETSSAQDVRSVAAAELRGLISKLIDDQPEHMDLVKAMRMVVTNADNNVRLEIGKEMEKRTVLAKRRGHMVRGGGEEGNLFVQVIDEKIAQINARIEAHEHSMAMNAVALELIGEYRWCGPEVLQTAGGWVPAA